MRPIDASDLRKKCIPFVRGAHGYSADIRKWAILVGDLDDAPTLTLDDIGIVRCKDCVYAEDACENGNGFLICPASGMEITDNDFCSYGERKRSETD